MKKIAKTYLEILPGLVVSLLLAMVAKIIEGLLPIHVIGASVIALFLGMIINSFFRPKWMKAGLKFTSKKVQEQAVVSEMKNMLHAAL